MTDDDRFGAQAMTPSPPDEREAIVRWLREKADTYRAVVTATFPPSLMTPELAADTAARWAELHFAANAIERGDHLSEQGEGYE